METPQSYVFMFVAIPERWVAHAPRVPAMASSPSRTSLDAIGFQEVSTNAKDCFGGTPLQRM